MSNGQTILITGATAGIGRHAALHFAAQGHRVIATGRNAAALAELRAAATGSLETVRLDVTDAASIAAAVTEVERLLAGQGLDALVNNAGYGLAGALSEISDQDLRAQFDTNVFGLMAVTRAFLPHLKTRAAITGKGRLLNVSSMAGRFTFPFFGAYHASKYAVEALSDALRSELAPFGIQVVLIEPGPIHSRFADRSMGTLTKLRSTDSPYGFVYEKADQIRARTDAQAVGPEHTSRAMERAVTSPRPRARYVVPFTVSIALALLKMLPTRVADWLMQRLIGLTRQNLRPATLAAPLAHDRAA